MQQEKTRQHGTRAATAAAAGPPEAAAALATGVGVPSRTSSSPGRILASSADLVGPDETSRISFNEVDVAAFDAVAEIAARDAEGLPTLLAESERQRISQDVAAKALLVAFDNSERQRLSQEAELRALRAQYDHLALRTDPGAGVINVDNLGAGGQICEFPHCMRRPWPGHPFCGRAHAQASGKFKRDPGLAGATDSFGPEPVYGARLPAGKFPPLRKFFQPPDSGWAVGQGSIYGDDDTVGVAAPPLPQPGGFGRADPAAVIAGLSTEWSGWKRGDPGKARTFSDHDWYALAGIQEAGRIAEALAGNLDFVGSALEVDSEASSVLTEVQDAIVALVESLHRIGDRFTLRWTHSAARYAAFQEFTRLYEDQAAGPKCMFSRNIELQHQVSLADLKSCKSTLSRSGSARGAQGDGRAPERSDPSRRRYTQAPTAAAGDRSNGAGGGGGRGGGSAGASAPKRGGGGGGASAASAAH